MLMPLTRRLRALHTKVGGKQAAYFPPTSVGGAELDVLVIVDALLSV